MGKFVGGSLLTAAAIAALAVEGVALVAAGTVALTYNAPAVTARVGQMAGHASRWYQRQQVVGIFSGGFQSRGGSTAWNPTNGPGPLGSQVASTFRSGTYTERTLSDPLVVYHTYGGTSGPLSSYWTRTSPTGPLQSRLDSALLSEWGNTATRVTRIRIPAGTTVFEGFAGPQRGVQKPFESILGGGSQIYISRVNPDWVIP